jgi:phosphoglycerate dehydrogenase-like enzyme
MTAMSLIVNRPDTEEFLDAEAFEILSKKKTFISNISRGKIIKQDDLIAALRAGKLRGAALDVATPEPLPADSELWDVPNLILTPHISGLSRSYTDRSFQILSANLKKREAGEKMFNVVDRKRGY